MTIIREYDGYYLSCDICTEGPEQPFDTFDEAVQYKKGAGWKSQKKYGEWQDVCPECAGERG